MQKSRKVNYSRRSWKSLTKKQQSSRVKSLSILKEVRHSQGLRSLSHIARDKHVSLKTVRRHLGKTIYKSKGKWFAKPKDRIERALNIFEKGKQVTVYVKDSKTASKIGRYASQVSKSLAKGKKRLHIPKTQLKFTDSSGKVHYLDSSLSDIKAIEESRPKKSYYELYP